MYARIGRRTFVAVATATRAAPAVLRAAEPLKLRCSLETVPAHSRNVTMRDYLGKVEAASHGRIKPQLFESGQLFPDLRVGTAMLQGQVDMAVPGIWSLTGIVPDADFFQLPALLQPPARHAASRRRRQAGAVARRTGRAQAQCARARRLARSRLFQLVLDQQAARLLHRSQGPQDPQCRRRRPGSGVPSSSAPSPTSRRCPTCRWRCRKARSTAIIETRPSPAASSGRRASVTLEDHQFMGSTCRSSAWVSGEAHP